MAIELEALDRKAAADDEINWVTAIFMGLFHVGAIAALFFFSWKALLVSMFLWWVSGSLGIGMGYHRLLTHRGYKTYRWVEYILTTCATLALEGGPIFITSIPIRKAIRIRLVTASGGRTWGGF
jgi:fatty-acid desaturase